MSVIDGFSQYYDYNYAYAFNDGRAKSDQIGIGGKGGAMENWGLVTYCFDCIYVSTDQKTDSVTTIAGVAEIVAHELQHQWTGNLSTNTSSFFNTDCFIK